MFFTFDNVKVFLFFFFFLFFSICSPPVPLFPTTTSQLLCADKHRAPLFIKLFQSQDSILEKQQLVQGLSLCMQNQFFLPHANDFPIQTTLLLALKQTVFSFLNLFLLKNISVPYKVPMYAVVFPSSRCCLVRKKQNYVKLCI